MSDVTAWLEATALATWVRESPSLWAYPTVLTLHTVGLGIVVGASTVLDLRILGYAPRIRLAALAPLFRLMVVAFIVNAATGVLLYIADATRKTSQPVFAVKLVMIFAALWCTVQAGRLVGDSTERADAVIPSRARTLAWLTLVLWTGAITAGRLMAYL